ncbi:MAG: sigma-70 family RNA polymerase sigma factor [Muribaculaceae bacterium]|nr:sigma-70 family RNA polymerase sigma factor [Muribaculaceae bacterium]
MNTETQRKQLFDTILAEYGPMVDKVCYMYGANEEQRKDLYQECMANVWQGLRNFRGDAKLSTWLYRACINTCITCYRRSRNEDVVPIDSAVQLAADESSRPDDLKEMYRLISCLTPVEKAIIMMWLDEKSYEEISEVTGMPRNTVASRLRRIKSKLVELGNS